jgi:hypothetical protein
MKRHGAAARRKLGEGEGGKQEAELTIILKPVNKFGINVRLVRIVGHADGVRDYLC